MLTGLDISPSECSDMGKYVSGKRKTTVTQSSSYYMYMSEKYVQQ